MATDATTPNVSDSAASPAVAAPSTTETPVITTPVVSTETAQPEKPRDAAEVLREAAAKLDIPGVERAKPAEKIPEQVAAEQKLAADTKAAADQKTAEDKAAADAGKTDQQKAAEKAKSDKTAVVDPLDKLGAIPAEKIGEALKSPEFVTACEKAGIDPAMLPQTARDAAEAGLFREVVATPEAAKYAVENAENFYKVEEGYLQVKDINSLDKFMTEVMVPMSYVLDANGQPIPDPQNPGAFLTDGSSEKFMGSVVEYDHGWTSKIADRLLESAAQFKDADGGYTTPRAEQVAAYADELKHAVQTIEDFRKAGYKMPSGEKPAQMSPEQKAEMDRLRARDAEVTKSQQDVHQQQIQILSDTVEKDTVSGTEPLIRDTLNATSLDEYGKTKAAEDIWKGSLERLKADTSYQRLKASHYQQIDQARKHAKTDDEFQKAAKPHFDRLVALGTKTMKNILYGPKGVVESVLQSAGARRQSAQQQRDQKIDAQIKTDTMNQGARAAASTNAAAPLSGDEAFQKAVELATKDNGGRTPDGGMILRARMKLLQSA